MNPIKMTTPQKKAQCASWFIEIKSDVQTQRNYRSMEETHHHVLQFVYGTRNLYRDKDSVDIRRSGSYTRI